MVGSSRCALGYDLIRVWADSGSIATLTTAERDTISESITSPDGEIGRHSGLKIV